MYTYGSDTYRNRPPRRTDGSNTFIVYYGGRVVSYLLSVERSSGPLRNSTVELAIRNLPANWFYPTRGSSERVPIGEVSSSAYRSSHLDG